MAHPHIQIVSRILRHAVGVLLICWLRAVRWGALAGLCGIAGTEIVAAIITRHFPPDGAAHIVAIALGAALAFGAATTVVADELLTGIVDAIRLLLGEAEAGARAAAVAAEREVGDASAGLLRVVGLGRLVGDLRDGSPASQPAMATPRAALAPQPRVAAQPVARASARAHVEETDDTGETLAELEASGALGPRARVDGRPVRADLLPRIGWTDEHEAIRPEMLAAAAAAAAAISARPDAPVHPAPADDADDTVPTPVEPLAMAAASPPQPEAAAPAPTTRPLPTDAARAADTVADEPPAEAASTDAPMGAGLAEPSKWHVDEAAAAGPVAWHDPLEHVELEQEDEVSGIQPVDLFGGPPPTPNTRPLPENTRPLETSGASETRHSSVWDHISQVLAGRPVDPLPPREDGAADTTAAGSGEDTPPAI